MKKTLNNKQHLSLIFLLNCILTMIIYGGCTEIFEPDISDEEVQLLTPPNNTTTPLLTHTFWWNEIEYADEYLFQLVSPSFSFINETIADTLTENYSITFILNPGTYQWRVSAKNYSGQTEFSTNTLVIDGSSLLANDTIQLMYPLSNDTINNVSQTIKWRYSTTADNYLFNLYYESDLVYSEETAFDTINIQLQWGEGSYKWEVRGQNEVATTNFSSRNFFLDTTVPTVPTLLTPQNNIELFDTIISFNWSRVTDSGSGIMDRILVYTNQDLTELKVSQLINGTHYEFYLEPGEYYWQVQSIDAAGNVSELSELRKLNIVSHSIADEEILMQYPLINDTINETLITFTWLQIVNANDYKLNLYYNSNLVYTINTSVESTEIDLIWGEGSYKWEVKANNSYSSTVFSHRLFYVDITSPDAPILLLPADNSESNKTLQLFTWERAEDFGSSLMDSLYIYNDLLMSSIRSRRLVNGTEYEHNMEVGDFFWRVLSVDAAGNKSDFTQIRKLTIIE